MIEQITKTFLYFVLTIIQGYALLYTIRGKKGGTNHLINLGLAIFLGIFIQYQYLTILALINALDFSSIVFVILSFSALGCLFYKRFIARRKSDHIEVASLNNRTQILLIIIIFLLTSIFVIPALLSPMNIWDARAMWLIKAKSFIAEPGFPNAWFTSEFYKEAHQDYPIGFSLIITGLSRFIGIFSEQLIPIYLNLFIVGIYSLIAGFIVYFSPKIQNFYVIVILILTTYIPMYFKFGLSGYTDLPFAFFVLVTVLSLMLGHRKDLKRETVKFNTFDILALLSALATANTKNEGITFFILTVGAVVLANIKINQKESQITKSLPKTLITALCNIFPFIVWFLITKSLKLENDLISGFRFTTVVDYFRRSISIITVAIKFVFDVNRWGYLFPVMIAYNTVTGLVLWKKDRLEKGYLLAIAVILTQIFIYFLIYLITPRDLLWHLSTSIERLILHFHPSIIVTAVYSYFQCRKSINK